MKRGWLGLVGAVLPTLLGAQAGRGGGPYARIAILRAHDGHTVDFEAGYIPTGNALYEYLPAPSRGTGEPQPTARLEFTTVDLVPLPGAEQAFEAALAAGQSAL